LAIVKMSRLKLAGLQEEKEALLEGLLKLGCVELESPKMPEEPEQWLLAAAKDEADDSALRASKARMTSALAVLDKYAPEKGGLFAVRPQIQASEFFSTDDVQTAVKAAEQILTAEEQVRDAVERRAALKNRVQTLTPWAELDCPVQTKETPFVKRILGTLPLAKSQDEIKNRLDAENCDYSFAEVSRSADTAYIRILVYKDDFETVWSILRQEGFAEINLPEEQGYVPEVLKSLQERSAQAELAVTEAEAGVKSLADTRSDLMLAVDRITQQESRQNVRKELLVTDSAFYTEGWIPTEAVPRLEKLLSGSTVGWETEEVPFEEDSEVPVKLKNNIITRCMNMVTNMYSLPQYGTVDPNPLMFPFFVAFYGLMMADMAYGILMFLAGILIMKKLHPREGMRNLAEIGIWCGISTFIFGALTGGFFGDFIPCVAKMINPNTSLTALPSLFTPLSDTLMILIGSLVLGVIQIVTGMIVSIVYKTKHGNFIDALFDEITWWIILAGVALAVLGIGNVSGVPVCLVVGALMLIFGGTREAKGFGKVTKLVGLVYNGVTGYFSDILSYARIMALMLAGSVIAQVFNTLGTVTGNVITFVIISLIGNILNFLLNILGCYVHDLRLQCLEFFNRFYHEGGRVFNPLQANTNYVDIINSKEE